MCTVCGTGFFGFINVWKCLRHCITPRFAKFDPTLILPAPTHVAICSELNFTRILAFIWKRSALVQIPGQLVLPHVLY